MKLRPLIAFLALATIPFTAAAHDGVFFEYAPDSWQSHRHAVTSAATPYQLFEMPSTETISGFDLWLDNTGSSGAVTFTVANEDGDTLVTKNITLSSITATDGGTKYHADFSTPLDLTGGEVYSIQITSQLAGMGLYYADRTTLLEHNKTYQTSYGYGAARLGSEEQAFTFKFALHSPSAGDEGDPESDEEEPDEEEPAPPPTSTSTVVSITNARVISKTANTVTIAWSTNLASDSKLTLRTQLNPLYITHTVTDDTLELEHSLTATALYPNTNYYADVYSANDNELVLTTYTLSFTTEDGAPPAPPEPEPTSTPPVTPPEEPEEDPDDEIIDVEPSGGGEELPPLEISGEGGGDVGFSWEAPPSGEPADGYRIDIFDANHNLIRSISVPPGTHSMNIEELKSGKHYAVVYANNDGVFEKVATPTAFTLQKKGFGFTIVVGITLVWLAALGSYMLWKSRKAKVVAAPESDTLNS